MTANRCERDKWFMLTDN